MSKKYILSNKHSLRERKVKSGKVYDVRFRIVDEQGVLQQKCLSGFKTKTAAKQAYLDYITTECELKAEETVIVSKTAQKEKKQSFLVKDLLEEYISSLPNQNKESSICDKMSIFKLYITPTLGERDVKNLSLQELYKWQDKLWSTKMSNGEFFSHQYLCKIRASLSAFLSWCETRYGVKNNMTMVKRPKRRKPKTEMKFWTKDEFQHFISFVEDPLYKTMFTMMFYTGRRKGEIIALNFEDIKENGIMFNKTYSRKTLNGGYTITSTKNETSDITPICPALKKALQEYKGESPYYFGGEHPISDSKVEKAFAKELKKSEVKKIRMHDLRHSFVSLLAHLGTPLTAVAALIGDTLEQVVKTYSHLYEVDKLKYLNEIK